MRGLFSTTIKVPPHTIGLLYHNNKFQKELAAGVYHFFDPIFFKKKSVYTVPSYELWTTVSNQEVLSKDNIAFRFSFHVSYRCSDPQQFVEQVGIQSGQYQHGYQPEFAGYQTANAVIAMHTQVVIRDILATVDSSEINEKRGSLLEGTNDIVQKAVSSYGLTIDQILFRDVSFPKRIQELFSLELESKIRAKADLENARTRVAAARALKNAGDMVAESKGLQFLQYLEVISKISTQGKHTFIIGDQVSQLPGSVKEN